MSLEQLSKTVDFVQDVTPSASDVNDGETYLDTSQSPPQLKVFDGSVGAFIRPRSIQNLDAPVSGAGATQTDIETGAEDALEKDISQLSPASNSVAANLDGGIAAVDWSSKTPEVGVVDSGSTLTVNGSGYLISIGPRRAGNDQTKFLLTIDGNTPTPFAPSVAVAGAAAFAFLHRFDSTLEVEETANNRRLYITYVLD